MYLSDRDIIKAIRTGSLIVDPKPTESEIGATSIDLHLDSVDQAKVWDISKFESDNKTSGHNPRELRIGRFGYREFSPKYTIQPPEYDPNHQDSPHQVLRRGAQVVVRPGGFLLWQTKEVIGTPEDNAKLICFVDGKSTRARPEF